MLADQERQREGERDDAGGDREHGGHTVREARRLAAGDRCRQGVRGHDREVHGGADRGHRLSQRVVHRGAVRDQRPGQLVQRRGGQRHQAERHADHHQREACGRVPGGGVGAQAREREHRREHQRQAGRGQTLGAEPVEQAAGDGAQHALDHAAGHQQQAGLQRRESQHVLDVHGQDAHRGDERDEDQHDLDHRQGEHRPGEHAEVEHGLAQAHLAPDEDDQRDRADGQRADRGRRGPAVLAGDAEPVQQAAETERRQDDRREVDARIGAFGHVAHGRDRDGEHGGGDDDQRHEQETPWQEIDDQTGQGRAQRRRERDDHAEPAHRGAALVGREHDEQHGLQQRHEDAGAGGLQDAAEQQHPETGGGGAHDGAEQEHADRVEEQLPCGEALDQERGDRDHDAVGEHERGGQPLRGVAGDAELGHEMRQRGGHQRLVEDRGEAADHHHEDGDELAFRRRRLRGGAAGLVLGHGDFHKTPRCLLIRPQPISAGACGPLGALPPTRIARIGCVPSGTAAPWPLPVLLATVYRRGGHSHIRFAIRVIVSNAAASGPGGRG